MVTYWRPELSGSTRHHPFLFFSFGFHNLLVDYALSTPHNHIRRKVHGVAATPEQQSRFVLTYLSEQMLATCLSGLVWFLNGSRVVVKIGYSSGSGRTPLPPTTDLWPCSLLYIPGDGGRFPSKSKMLAQAGKGRNIPQPAHVAI